MAWGLPFLAVHAADFRVDGFLVSSGQHLVLEHASQTDAYYQVWMKGSLSDPWVEVRHMHLGIEGTQTWTDTTESLPSMRGYYRLLRIPRSVPRDYDGDGMDDVYELEWMFLDPLEISDAFEDQDEDTVSNLAEYLGGSRPDNPDSDEDGIRDDVDPRPITANAAPIVESISFSSGNNFHANVPLSIHVTALDEDGDSMHYELSIDAGDWEAVPVSDYALQPGALHPGNLIVAARAGDVWGAVGVPGNASRYVFRAPPTP